MAEEPDISEGLAGEVQAALASLDSVLAEAGRSVAQIRSNLSQIASLERKVQDMEAAVSRALESLSSQLGAASAPAPAPLPLRPLEPAEPIEPAAQAQAVDEPLQPEHRVPQQASWGQEAPKETKAPASNCLRLNVSSQAGSLDLKAVDGSVNEVPDVVDVALLDYDGRHATLKLWINASADPSAVRESLLESLTRRLGDAENTDVQLDFEEAA
jgi:enamine deaminase RidA (YjgF/YER057c/UK114 family)